MTWQRHIIKKQVIALQVDKDLHSHDIQNRVSQVFRDSIVQLIDATFNAGSPPGSIAKIDRLELDLGRIPVSRLEEKLVEKMAEELQRNIPAIQKLKIPAQTKRNGNDAQESGSGLDTIAYFLQSGLLPWWATANSRRAFEQALEESLTHEPVLLKKLLAELLQDDTALHRFINSCSDQLLYSIMESYITGATADIKKQEARFAELIEGDADAALLKQRWWQNIIRMVTHERRASPVRLAEHAAALVTSQTNKNSRLNGQTKKTASINENEISAALPQINTAQVNLLVREIAAYITSIPAYRVKAGFSFLPVNSNGSGLGSKVELAGSPLRINVERSREAIKEIQAFLVKVTGADQVKNDLADDKNMSSHFRALQNLIRANKEGVFTASQKQQVQATCNSIAGEVSLLLVKATDESAIVQIKKLQNALQRMIAFIEAVNPVQPLQQTEKKTGTSKKLYNPFTETEKIYIQNAGLVLLWPFLNRFFENTGLASEKAFVDESAAEKACLMLQHLTGVTPEDLFEAQLPLNKLLCGIDLNQPVNTQWIIEPDETEAAENFLAAVIQNGPLWKTLSIPAFRQAYLNREGILGTRDGNWLLQVKRETYDVIVDRLPWTIQAVKLPWMEHLVFVEW